jgi:hypothetical protein
LTPSTASLISHLVCCKRFDCGSHDGTRALDLGALDLGAKEFSYVSKGIDTASTGSWRYLLADGCVHSTLRRASVLRSSTSAIPHLQPTAHYSSHQPSSTRHQKVDLPALNLSSSSPRCQYLDAWWILPYRMPISTPALSHSVALLQHSSLPTRTATADHCLFAGPVTFPLRPRRRVPNTSFGELWSRSGLVWTLVTLPDSGYPFERFTSRSTLRQLSIQILLDWGAAVDH